MKPAILYLSLATIIALSGAFLCFRYQPRLSLNSQQFGLMTRWPAYRSWFLSFSDGRTIGPSGKWQSVVIDEKKGTMRFGYRWWPRYSHCDMVQFLKAHPEVKEISNSDTP